MRRFYIVFVLVALYDMGYPIRAFGQGDWAFYETFNNYSQSVYSIRVEIPQEFIFNRHEELIKQYQGLRESYYDLIAKASEPVPFQHLYKIEQHLTEVKNRFDMMTKQMLENNPIKGVGFAIDQRHLVTLSTVVESATLGGDITIQNDLKHTVGIAKVKGVDEMTGVAVLYVENATFAQTVDFDRIHYQLPVTSFIMSVQRPYELPTSPIPGMIGGYYRQINKFPIERYIQTNLQLYPNNEGAPVFSPTGQLIGMIAAEYHVGDYPGVTLVIPADIIVDSALSIIENGRREHGWIAGWTLEGDMDGVIIRDIQEGSPADSAGFQNGDLIIEIDGKREKEIWKVIGIIQNTYPNQSLNVTVKRGEKILDVSVTTTSMKSNS